ncbi:hypothetical protein DL93DRAFT_1142342 [Clavulina sp. PMI_390]|nr:hypothetical protein DL93DRAFT_1142342 [Clavulina sp. PMI_390]
MFLHLSRPATFWSMRRHALTQRFLPSMVSSSTLKSCPLPHAPSALGTNLVISAVRHNEWGPPPAHAIVHPPTSPSTAFQVLSLSHHSHAPHDNTTAHTSAVQPSLSAVQALPIYMITTYPPPSHTVTLEPIEESDLTATSGRWPRTKQWLRNKLQTWTWGGILGAAAAISTIIATVLVIVWK